MTAISTCTTWLFNFVVAEITPIGFDTLGYRYFIIYAVINLCLVLPTVYLLFPETNGRYVLPYHILSFVPIIRNGTTD